MKLLTGANQADKIRGVMKIIERNDRLTLFAREERGFRLPLDLLLLRARMGLPDR